MHFVFADMWCPENIVFCIDVAQEMANQEFSKGADDILGSTGSPRTRLDVIVHALSAFVQNKAEMSPAHRYAVCVLTDRPEFLLEFTSDVALVRRALRSLKPISISALPDLSSLLPEV